MIALVAAAVVTGATPGCKAPLPHGPPVPAQVIFWNSCGAYALEPSGRIQRLPRHWLARHSGGTGRAYEPRIDIRRNRAGEFLLRESGRTIWRSRALYPNDGGDVAFGPHEFAFASYNRGIYLTDLRGPERLVVRGRGLFPYAFNSDGSLIVVGSSQKPLLISSSGRVLRRYSIRSRNGFAFDQASNSFFFVTPHGRLARARGRSVELGWPLAGISGSMQFENGVVVFVADNSLAVTTPNGRLLARATWPGRNVHVDSGVSVAADRRSFAYRLSNARPGSGTARAAIYVLRAGQATARRLYQHRLGPTGCAVGAGLSWHGRYFLYGSSDGALAVLDSRTGRTRDLAGLAHRLPHRGIAVEEASAAWLSDLQR